jgi:hypothetical protein
MEVIQTKVRTMEVAEGSDKLSALDLFRLYAAFTTFSSGIGSLAVDAERFSRESPEGAALMGAKVAAHTADSNLFPLLIKQLKAEESELRVCRDTR